MSDEQAKLELIVKPYIRGESNYTIEGIPRRIMNSFKERAKEILPEKGDKAWSALLCEVITSHLESNETTSYIMTEIPIQFLKKMEEITNQINISVDNLFAGIIKAAGNNSLHLLNLHFPPEMDHTGWRCMIIMGISNEAWQSWATYAKKMGTTPEELYGHILESAYTGQMETNPNMTDEQTAENIKKLSELPPDKLSEILADVEKEVEKAKRNVGDMSDWDITDYENI